jgi:hypothetical protein
MNALITSTERRVLIAVAAVCIAVGFWVVGLIQSRLVETIAR